MSLPQSSFGPGTPQRLTMTQWLICVMAAIGFAFDIYELLMLPLILPPAVRELAGGEVSQQTIGYWRSIMFFVPAFAGGIFGLLGGYLTDRLGRRRVLTWSILLYAFSAFAAGFSTSLWILLVLRTTTFIGVCVEFVAAVAWLAELFPEPRQRERVLGYTQAFSSVGGLLVAFANAAAVKYAPGLPAIMLPDWLASSLGQIQQPHAAWRYTLMSGLIPAIPLIVIRPFLPESPVWAARKAAGTLKRPSLGELFAPRLRRTTLVTTLMFACSYGAAFGAIQQLPEIVRGLPQVKEQVAGKPADKQRLVVQKVAADVTKVQEIGGLTGRVILAVLAGYVVSRRKLLRVFLLPGLLIMPWVFGYAALHDLRLLNIGIFFAGLVTVAQFSFWGNYLPRVYPVHLRGTGESFAANIGGRMIGTSFAALANVLAVQNFMPGGSPAAKMAYTAAGIGLTVYVVNLVASFFLPEPGLEEMDDD